MLLHVSVILFTGGVVSQHAGGIPACLAAGIWGGGIPACLAGFQAHTQGEVEGDLARGVSRPTPRVVLQAHTCGVYASLHRGKPPPPPDVTAVGSTHPTGMHSCCLYFHVFWLVPTLFMQPISLL